MIGLVYLDNAATTRVSPEVVRRNDSVLFEEVYWECRQHSLYGKVCEKRIDIAREQVSRPIGAKPENIIFTSCGSEANKSGFIWSCGAIFQKLAIRILSFLNIDYDSVLGCST